MILPTREVDFVAYDDRGQAVLLVEVKSSHGPETSGLWAARFRRNMMAHGTLPAARFFMIATPERMYFWRQEGVSLTEEPPQFTIDAAKELKPYFEKFGQTPEKTSGQALELIVFSWLNDLADSGQSRAEEDVSLKWLSESGLLGALERTRIEFGRVQ
jgi:hypothetical protein